MGKCILYRYLLILSLLLPSLWSGATVNIHRIPARPVNSHGSIYGKEKLPHTELELANHPVTSPSHSSIHKTPVKESVQQSPVPGYANTLLIILSDNRITPPEKEYLCHNYPSHNFW